MSAAPRLAHGIRLQYEQAQDAWVLLYPEGMVKLNGSAAEILRRCDGTRDEAAIVDDLAASFDGVERADLQADVGDFLAFARQHRWVAS